MEPFTKSVELATRVVFGAAAIILMVFAFSLCGYGVWLAVRSVGKATDFSDAILAGVGYVIVAIAVFEVAKYLFEEEVVRGRELRVASEARRSLTKIISTITIATLLESLVIMFRMSHDRVSDLIYPALLFLAAILLVVGLGVYQRLSASVEHEVEGRDRADERKAKK